MTAEKNGGGGDGDRRSPTDIGHSLHNPESAYSDCPGPELSLSDRPEVKALLAELSKGLKEGDDPLYYDWTDADAPAPAKEAQVYVAGVELKPMQQQTMDLERVRVGQDPSRRAVTTRIPSRGSVGAPPLPTPPESSPSSPESGSAQTKNPPTLTSSHNLSIPVTISSCDGAPTPNHSIGVQEVLGGVP